MPLPPFTEFLHQKRIHADAWKQRRPEEYGRMEQLFGEMGAASFDQQKKFLFNPVRLEFPLPEELVPAPVKKERPSLTKPASTEASTTKAPPLRKKLPLKKAATDSPGQPKPSPPPLKGKLPLKKKSNTDASSEESKPKPPPLKGKLPLKKKIVSEEAPAESEEPAKPKAPPLKGKLPLKTKPGTEEPEPESDKPKPPRLKKKLPLRKKEEGNSGDQSST